MLITCQNDTILDTLSERKCISKINFTFLFYFPKGWWFPLFLQDHAALAPGSGCCAGRPRWLGRVNSPARDLGYQLRPGQVTKGLCTPAPLPPAPYEMVIITMIISWGWGPRKSRVKYVEPRLALQDVLSKGSLCFSHRFAWEVEPGAPFFPAGPPDLGLPPEQPPLCRRGEGGLPRWPPAGRESSFLWCSLHKAPLLGQRLRWCHFLCHTNKPPCDPSFGFLPARALSSQTPAPALISVGLRAPPPPHPPFFRCSHHTVGDTIAA